MANDILLKGDPVPFARSMSKLINNKEFWWVNWSYIITQKPDMVPCINIYVSRYRNLLQYIININIKRHTVKIKCFT